MKVAGWIRSAKKGDAHRESTLVIIEDVLLCQKHRQEAIDLSMYQWVNE